MSFLPQKPLICARFFYKINPGINSRGVRVPAGIYGNGYGSQSPNSGARFSK